MSLIACAECGSQISDKAASCPRCGAPVPRPLEQTVTTQATAKTFKLQQIIATIVVIVGVLILIIAEPGAGKIWGLVITGIGVVLHIMARVGAWWHSG